MPRLDPLHLLETKAIQFLALLYFDRLQQEAHVVAQVQPVERAAHEAVRQLV